VRGAAVTRDLPSAGDSIFLSGFLFAAGVALSVRSAAPLAMAGVPYGALAIGAFIAAPVGFGIAGVWMRAAHARRESRWFTRAQVLAGLSALAVLAGPALIFFGLVQYYPLRPPPWHEGITQAEKWVDGLTYGLWLLFGGIETRVFVIDAPASWREFRRVESLLQPTAEERAARGEPPPAAE
jgi:hypothetical protein